MHLKAFFTGAATAAALRTLVPRLLLAKFRRDIEKLNDGDYSTLLDAFAEDAVLHFNDGDHRWAGDWVGKPAIERFLQNFTAAKVRGELKQIAVSGPPWALTMLGRFDDHADGPNGTRLYENRTVLVVRTKWGKIIDQEDFYVDTGRIAELERSLTDLGVAPIPKWP